MPLTAQQIADFRQKAVLFGMRPMQKVMRSPMRMGGAYLLHGWLRLTGRARRTRAKTFWGDSMNLVLPERGSNTLYRYNFTDEGLTSIFLACVKPGMTVFDIGAHFGYFTLLASALVGESGQVHSFEPTPSTIEILRANAGGKTNVRINPLAVFSRKDSLTLNDFGVRFSQFNSIGAGRISPGWAKASSYTVQAVTLDDYLAESGAKPTFIKIDAENAELEILKGAARMLETLRPMLTLEVGDIKPELTTADAIHYLIERDYRPMEYADGELREHALRDRYRYDNLLLVPAEMKFPTNA